MNKRVLLATIVFAIVFGVALGFVQGMPDDFDGDLEATAVEYGYRCGDGSEFTVDVLEAMGTITITPATSADYLQRTELMRVGDTFVGGGITFTPHGIKAELTSATSAPTTCTSMNSADQMFFD